MNVITTPDAAALMRDLTDFWGGRYGARWDLLIAEHTLAKAKENAAIVRDSIGTPGYVLGRKIALERLRRCRRAVRKVQRELEGWE